MKIPISAAKKIAKDRNLLEVMVVGWDAETSQVQVATYGEDKYHCDAVAILASKFMKFLGVKMKEGK